MLLLVDDEFHNRLQLFKDKKESYILSQDSVTTVMY